MKLKPIKSYKGGCKGPLFLFTKDRQVVDVIEHVRSRKEFFKIIKDFGKIERDIGENSMRNWKICYFATPIHINLRSYRKDKIIGILDNEIYDMIETVYDNLEKDSISTVSFD